MLPEIKDIKSLPFFTPTRWQTVILRNYGLIPTERIAAVLQTDGRTVEREAARLGLEGMVYDGAWQKNGYVTLIKNNWHLLPYDQLLSLLDMDEATLLYSLKEDDFLLVKLGYFKAKAEPVLYAPLTAEEEAETERLGRIIRRWRLPQYTKPFLFYNKEDFVAAGEPYKKSDFEKIVYSYSMLYGDTFLDGGDVLPDGLLRGLAACGVNGIWMQGVLSSLSPYPFAKGVDKGYELRRKNLAAMIEKCKAFGIGIYLYFNEPRGLRDDQFTALTEPLRGRYAEGTWSLCTTKKEVQDYLYGAVRDLLEAVPELAGIITITMSENTTNCHCRPGNTCPHCRHLPHADVIPEVNNIMYRAVRDSGARTKLLANLWSWTAPYGWSEEDICEGIRRMDPAIDILSVSEMGGILTDAGREEIREYAISRPGPSEETKAAFAAARENGHRTLAKVQINNSWEFAVVPYIPVFDLILTHLSNLKREDIGGLMLSWTVGGYPTPALDLACRFFEDGFDYNAWLVRHFGENAEAVKTASSLFSAGFAHYPHTMDTLYKGAQELGPANFLYPEKTGYPATMVTFPYDDYESWRGEYTEDEFLAALDALLADWERGLAILEGKNGNEAFTELCRYAEVVYVNMKSMRNQFLYYLARDGKKEADVHALLLEEEALTRRLYTAAAEDARIGYEASCHYYFTENTFLEKMLNLAELKEKYQ